MDKDKIIGYIALLFVIVAALLLILKITGIL